MNDFLPNMTSSKNNLDWDQVLYFLTDYHALEGALGRAGFVRAGRLPGDLRPDWRGFARHIADRFDPDCSPELMGAACTLLADPDHPGFLRERRPEAYRWEAAIPERDTIWLQEVVQEIRDRLLLRINFAQAPACDETNLMAALVLVEAWSKLDPQVESLLGRMQ